MDEAEPERKRRSKRRSPDPKPLSEQGLHEVALRYLERFDSSAQNLRRVLRRHVRRVALRCETDVEIAEVWINALVERYLESGLLNDQRYAEAMAAGLRRRGASQRAIVQKLGARGVSSEVAGAVLRTLEPDGTHDAELKAAQALVRRRRMGGYRPAAERAAKARRDLMALARAGFGFDVARRALDVTSDDEDVF